MDADEHLDYARVPRRGAPLLSAPMILAFAVGIYVGKVTLLAVVGTAVKSPLWMNLQLACLFVGPLALLAAVWRVAIEARRDHSKWVRGSLVIGVCALVALWLFLLGTYVALLRDIAAVRAWVEARGVGQ